VSVRERASEIERERESESARKRVDGQQSGLGNTEPWAQPAVNGDVVVLVNLGFALLLITHPYIAQCMANCRCTPAL